MDGSRAADECASADEVAAESTTPEVCSSAGAEEFRVRVSLEHFFSDVRARLYMWVSRRRPVRSLARRLRRAYRLPRHTALLSRGHLLPPDEPLAVLRPDDPVTVIPIWIENTGTDYKRTDAEEEEPAEEAGGGDGRDRVDAAESLDHVKQRALAILQQYESAPPAPTSAPRRRRVRRRPRPPAAAAAAAAEAAAEAAAAPAGVVRCGAGAGVEEGERAPRLVRALDAPVA